MTEAKKILNMIENVDPSDTDTLDEIDARVWCWIRGIALDLAPRDSGYKSPRISYMDNAGKLLRTDLYTRSRDALKAIRPDGWHWRINQLLEGKGWENGYICVLTKTQLETTGRLNVIFVSGKNRVLPTQELAELSATIQAINYERTR